jgi:hypothetical protein
MKTTVAQQIPKIKIKINGKFIDTHSLLAVRRQGYEVVGFQIGSKSARGMVRIIFCCNV